MSAALVGLLLVGFVVVFYGVVYLFRNYPILKEKLPLGMVVEFVQMTVAYWGFGRKYSDAGELIAKSVSLSYLLSADTVDLRKARKQVRELLQDLHKTLHPGRPMDDLDMDSAMVVYILLISHKEIADVIRSIQAGPKSIEVEKATYLAIDVFGEFINLQTNLGQKYFQHLIFGLNKALLLIRDNGTHRRTLKKVVSTLFRVYKITKAYRHRLGLKNLTEVELYEKVIGMFGRMRNFANE